MAVIELRWKKVDSYFIPKLVRLSCNMNVSKKFEIIANESHLNASKSPPKKWKYPIPNEITTKSVLEIEISIKQLGDNASATPFLPIRTVRLDLKTLKGQQKIYDTLGSTWRNNHVMSWLRFQRAAAATAATATVRKMRSCCGNGGLHRGDVVFCYWLHCDVESRRHRLWNSSDFNGTLSSSAAYNSRRARRQCPFLYSCISSLLQWWQHILRTYQFWRYWILIGHPNWFNTGPKKIVF